MGGPALGSTRAVLLHCLYILGLGVSWWWYLLRSRVGLVAKQGHVVVRLVVLAHVLGLMLRLELVLRVWGGCEVVGVGRRQLPRELVGALSSAFGHVPVGQLMVSGPGVVARSRPPLKAHLEMEVDRWSFCHRGRSDLISPLRLVCRSIGRSVEVAIQGCRL